MKNSYARFVESRGLPPLGGAAETEHTQELLRQRTKELNCVYYALQLVRDPGAELDDVVEQLLDALVASLRFPESSVARVRLDDRTWTSPQAPLLDPDPAHVLREEIMVAAQPAGTLELFVSSPEARHSPDCPVARGEERLLQHMAEMIGVYYQQHKAQLALRDREERMRQVTETMEEVFWLSSLDQSEMLYVSPAYEKVWGRTCESLYRDPSSFLEAVIEDDRPTVEQELARYREGGAFNLQYRIARPDGEVRHVAVRAHPVTDESGQRTRSTGIARDITEEVKTQRKLERQNRTLETFFSVTPSLLCIADLEGNFVKVNGAWERILGYPAHELEQRRFLEFLHPEDLEPTLEAMKQLTEGLDVSSFENRYRARDGSYRVLRWQAGADDNLIYAAADDITEQAMLEQQLEEDKEFLRSVIDGSPNPIFAKDWNGRHTLANTALEKLFGKPKDEIIGRRDYEFSPSPEQIEAFLHDDREVMTSGQQKFIPEEQLTDASGTNRWFQTVKVPLFAERAPEERQVLGIATDITDLKEARGRAEEANEAKSRFLANMSHEIRTPLNGLLGLSYLAIEQAADPTVRNYLHRIREAGKGLLDIVNQILDFSKLEAGRVTLGNRRFELRTLMEGVAEMFRPSLENKDLELRTAVSPEIPDCLNADSARLKQILLNLVGNAVKHTERGSITISVTLTGRSAQHLDLEFEVADTGVGISQHDQARLFESFQQLDGSTSREHGGTGLGLSISKQLVELMGGRIWVESEPGRGSRFCFELPVSPAGENDGEAAEHDTEEHDTESLESVELDAAVPADRSLSVLLVEDNYTNRIVAQRLLESVGVEVTTAENGREALELVAESRFDAVLMDLQTPEMDGYTAAQEIRALPDETKSRVPIIALTAHVLPEDRERSIAAGMNDHVSKPFVPEELVSTISKWLPDSEPTAPQPIAAQPTAPQPAVPQQAAADERAATRLRSSLQRMHEMLEQDLYIDLAFLESVQADLIAAGATTAESKKLREALEQLDYNTAKLVLSSLKARFEAEGR